MLKSTELANLSHNTPRTVEVLSTVGALATATDKKLAKLTQPWVKGTQKTNLATRSCCSAFGKTLYLWLLHLCDVEGCEGQRHTRPASESHLQRHKGVLKQHCSMSWPNNKHFMDCSPPQQPPPTTGGSADSSQ
jgi:hypothetical protein